MHWLAGLPALLVSLQGRRRHQVTGRLLLLGPALLRSAGLRAATVAQGARGLWRGAVRRPLLCADDGSCARLVPTCCCSAAAACCSGLGVMVGVMQAFFNAMARMAVRALRCGAAAALRRRLRCCCDRVVVPVCQLALCPGLLLLQQLPPLTSLPSAHVCAAVCTVRVCVLRCSIGSSERSSSIIFGQGAISCLGAGAVRCCAYLPAWAACIQAHPCWGVNCLPSHTCWQPHRGTQPVHPCRCFPPAHTPLPAPAPPPHTHA